MVGGLYFANGITPTADGWALAFAETQAPAAVEVLAHRAAGRHRATELPASPFLDRSTPRALLLRKLVWRLPDRLQPQIEPIVWVVAFDPDSGEACSEMQMTQPDFGTVTGVVERDGRLWLGSLGFPAVAHCALP